MYYEGKGILLKFQKVSFRSSINKVQNVFFNHYN